MRGADENDFFSIRRRQTQDATFEVNLRGRASVEIEFEYRQASVSGFKGDLRRGIGGGGRHADDARGLLGKARASLIVSSLLLTVFVFILL